MEKQEAKSKWDELARDLGAEIPPEIQQREEAVATPAEASGPRSPSARSKPDSPVRPPLPKRAADWDHLADELGLPPLESVPRAIQDEPPAPELRPVPKATPVERPRREHRDRPEPSEKRREPGPSGGNVAREPRGQSPPKSETRAAPPAATREEPAKPAAAVSLWHKIFGLPADETAKYTEISTSDSGSPEKADVREEPRSVSRSGSTRSQSAADAPAAEAEYVEQRDRGDEPSRTGDEAESSDRQRGRPRRRRRGRGRKSGERQTEARPAAPRSRRDDESLSADKREDEFDDLGELEDSEPDDEMNGLDPLLDDDATDIDDDGAPKPGTAKTTRSKSTLQRTIPSWDEAIGFIVESNMQSRSQRRPPPRTGARGGASRGRPRGRRRNDNK